MDDSRFFITKPRAGASGSALVLLLTALLSSGFGRGAEAPDAVYEVFRISQPIAVDGVLDEAYWKTAPAFTFRDNLTGSPDPHNNQAWAGYDDRFIYFAFKIEDPNIWATMTERDQHLWTEEVVEVFLQADPGHPSYIELEVNPLGAMLDIFLIDIRKPIPYSSWNSARLQWAVQVDGTVDGQAGDRGWSCEIALPLLDVVTAPRLPPQPGDRWRINLYVVDRRPQPAGLSWAPTLQRDFHVPSRFGEIVFNQRSLP